MSAWRLKSITRLIKRIKKKNETNSKSYRPKNVEAETRGKRKTNSISYSKKNIQISKNCIGTLIGFWVVGLKPHS